MQRRKFIKNSTLGMTAMVSSSILASGQEMNTSPVLDIKSVKPMVVCTWNFQNATSKAWTVLNNGGNALDAVEQGVMIEESDPTNETVGLGGRPDRDGHVSLDACIMNKEGKCGSVVALQNIVHAISVARKVMENTPHVMLAGLGAETFAYESGFKKTNLLTESTKKQYEEWKKTSKYEPLINIENHDTIGMLAIDQNGDIAGACTTSGLAYKMAGRVGDSPIIGSGLFIDNDIGGCVATGLGEEVVKTVGSFLVVELMRQGKTPQQACEEAINRIANKPNSDYKNFQVGYIALNKQGVTGAYAIHQYFSMTKNDNGNNVSIQSDYLIKV
jgi:N4-(beta-N-acetylglucosaminyl)-L-asparaginase